MPLYGICLSDISDRAALYARLCSGASHDRRARAARCRMPEDAVRCLLADALLRYALRQAGVELAVVSDPPVEVGAYGKPRIKGMTGFHYNLSHGGAWVVLAWDIMPVGVDIEPMDETRDVCRLAARFFTAEEQAYLRMAATETEIRERFYALWTAKESYLKYTGEGLTHGMVTPPVMEDGSVGEGVCLTRRRLPDGHWLAVCGLSPVGEMQRLSLEDLMTCEIS